jgi:hypothetical protein
MRKQSILFFFGSVVVVAATFFVITAQAPEVMRVTSDDTRVTVSGFARASLPFLIRDDGATAGVPLRGNIYRIEPDGLTLEQPATIQYSLDGLVQTDTVQLYQFDPDLSMWTALDVSAREPAFLASKVDRLGRFALGDAFVVNAPTFLTTFDTLRAKAPEHTVGYQMAVGAQVNAESASPIIKLLDQTEIGGCGGIVGAGEHEEETEIKQTLNVLVNDVETAVTFTFRARWFIGAEGCPQAQPLAAFSSVI